jgi:hypothetical protein
MSPPPFNQDEKQLELIERLNHIPGIFIDKSKIHKRPNLDVLLLKEEAAFQEFMKIITDIVAEHEQSV